MKGEAIDLWYSGKAHARGGKLASARPEALATAIGQYETAMREYGFAAVRLSLGNARQATSGPLNRTAFRAMLRATSTLPPLKRQFARALGS